MSDTIFASEQWATAFGEELAKNASVLSESGTWIYGPLQLVVDAGADSAAATVLNVDLDSGSVGGVQRFELGEQPAAGFVLNAGEVRWKAIFSGELNVVDSIMESKLIATGDLPTLVRHRGLLDAVAASAAAIDTSWPSDDEA